MRVLLHSIEDDAKSCLETHPELVFFTLTGAIAAFSTSVLDPQCTFGVDWLHDSSALLGRTPVAWQKALWLSLWLSGTWMREESSRAGHVTLPNSAVRGVPSWPHLWLA